ncbi:hypothetical protein K4S31_12090 [Staphylococcus epidermidis]|nr:hypothetical protein [Staphylococcus epidermidis]MCG2405767.1 hypothetical protein [Staphylococcus epidermidis]
MQNKDSKLNLEETLIPYPDSYDLQKNNEIQYITRIGKPYMFEKHILLSRSSIYDNEDLLLYEDNVKDLVDWYHSTVYNLNTDILDENNIVKSPSDFLINQTLERIHKNIENVQDHLLFNDIIVLKNNKVYKYLLNKNLLLQIYTYNSDEVTFRNDVEEQYFTNSNEVICILTNPKRAATILGEKSYQKSLISSGELSYIIKSQIDYTTIKLREVLYFYDFSWLAMLGYEDSDKVLTHIFEIHS